MHGLVRGNERGAALIEAIVALAVLATIGGAAAWSASESLRAVHRAWLRESRTHRAAQLLTAVSLWPRDDLDRHLGTTPQGPWRLSIYRTEPMLYEVTLADSGGGPAVLQTTLFRPEQGR